MIRLRLVKLGPVSLTSHLFDDPMHSDWENLEPHQMAQAEALYRSGQLWTNNQMMVGDYNVYFEAGEVRIKVSGAKKRGFHGFFTRGFWCLHASFGVLVPPLPHQSPPEGLQRLSAPF